MMNFLTAMPLALGSSGVVSTIGIIFIVIVAFINRKKMIQLIKSLKG